MSATPWNCATRLYCPFSLQEDGPVESFFRSLGRKLGFFEYSGASDAEHVVVCLGAAAGPCEVAARGLNAAGGKFGVLRVRVYRPWSAELFLSTLPKSAKRLAVLDNTRQDQPQLNPSIFFAVGFSSARYISQLFLCSPLRNLPGTWGPLFLDVAAALTKSTAAPAVVGAVLGVTGVRLALFNVTASLTDSLSFFQVDEVSARALLVNLAAGTGVGGTESAVAPDMMLSLPSATKRDSKYLTMLKQARSLF